MVMQLASSTGSQQSDLGPLSRFLASARVNLFTVANGAASIFLSVTILFLSATILLFHSGQGATFRS